VDDWNWALAQKDPAGVVWTKSFEFSNYVEAYKNFYVSRVRGGLNYRFYITDMFVNSILYAGGCGLIATITPCLASYLCARYRYQFGKIAYTVVLITMAIPIVGNLPSEIQMVKNIGLYGNIFGLYILKANFLGIYFLIFYAQFKMIPKDYTEAAKIDGASNLRIMLMIVIPQAMNIIVTIFFLSFINYWNDYQVPMLYLPDYPVAAYGLFDFLRNNTDAASYATVKMAGTLIMTLPVLLLVIIFNKRLRVSVSIGGIKG
jgi:ABC-type glycerol-3-phosphate transport system permease component